MKSIFIYSPYWLHFGGGDRYLLYLATAISKLPGTSVTLLGKFERTSKEKYQKYFNIDLSDIKFETVRDYSSSLKRISSGADIFIFQSNFRTLKATPRNYVLSLQIPYARITLRSMAEKFLRGGIKEAAKDMFRLRLHRFARSGSGLVLSNSQFVRDTLFRNFGVRSEVLYPPISDYSTEGIQKRRIILSVGRFFRGSYNDKRYDVLTKTFRTLSSSLPEWEYHIVGSVSADKNSQTYLSGLEEASRGCRIIFHVNESYESLKKLYNEATIYWHGAGFQIDETKHPEGTEHFGMSVAEALSTGCIPIVVNKGGLKEIVKEGENGFLWESPNQLMDITLNVARMSPNQLTGLQSKARESYQRYAMGRFDERVVELFTPLLTPQ